MLNEFSRDVNYLDIIPCFTSPLILLNTSAIPIPIFPAIISAVFSESSLMMPLVLLANSDAVLFMEAIVFFSKSDEFPPTSFVRFMSISILRPIM